MSLGVDMDWLSDWLQDIWDSFENWGKSLLLTVWDMLKDFLIFLLEFLLEVAVLILEGLGTLFDSLNLAQYISAIPPDVQNIMGLIGLGQAMGIIVTSLVIRIMLQLIPFVRLGS